jgi:hypothetical protein
MKLARHDLVAALELRYDHYSSKSLFEAACRRAGLDDQDQYSAAEVAQFRAALSKIGDRLQRVDDRLDSLLGDPKPANVPQDPTPMPAKPEPTPTRDEPKPANVPQDPVPMPAAEPVKAKPANVPQDPVPMPAATTSANVPQDAAPKPANVPQDPTPMPVAPKSADVTRIILTGLELADGEELFVCGDHAELGNWDPERARPMMRDGDVWSAVVTPGAGEFKFLRRTEDGVVVWEGGENREVGTALTIETSWQP